MQLNFKKAIIIGETRLCTQCAEHLINNNWKIIKVMSDDKTVIDWSNNHSIEVLPTAELNTIKENNFYLFIFIFTFYYYIFIQKNKGKKEIKKKIHGNIDRIT